MHTIVLLHQYLGQPQHRPLAFRVGPPAQGTRSRRFPVLSTHVVENGAETDHTART